MGDGRFPKWPTWARSVAVMRERITYLEQRRVDGILGGYRLQELHHLHRTVGILEALVPVAVDVEWELQKRSVEDEVAKQLHARLLAALVKAGIVNETQGPVGVES